MAQNTRAHAAVAIVVHSAAEQRTHQYLAGLSVAGKRSNCPNTKWWV